MTIISPLIPGLKGDTGATGSAGAKGDTGDTGLTGNQGDTGATGSAGAKGDTGDQGDTGAKGDTGSIGLTGDQGDTGSQGDTGAAGSAVAKGDTGSQGDTGAKGDTGSQGDTGAAGSAVAKGDTGSQGDTGAKGDTGSSLNLNMSLSDHSVSGITITRRADAAFSLFEIGYIKSDGDIAKAKADAAGTVPALLIASAAIDSESNGSWLSFGVARDDSWTWTIGGPLYVSPSTAGAMTQTRPNTTGNQIQIVGYALSATIILWCPNSTIVEYV